MFSFIIIIIFILVKTQGEKSEQESKKTLLPFPSSTAQKWSAHNPGMLSDPDWILPETSKLSPSWNLSRITSPPPPSLPHPWILQMSELYGVIVISMTEL